MNLNLNGLESVNKQTQNTPAANAVRQLQWIDYASYVHSDACELFADALAFACAVVILRYHSDAP